MINIKLTEKQIIKLMNVVYDKKRELQEEITNYGKSKEVSNELNQYEKIYEKLEYATEEDNNTDSKIIDKCIERLNNALGEQEFKR